MTIKIYAPASSGNLSVGFDALGLALAPTNGELLGDIVEVEERPHEAPNELLVAGPFASWLPQDLNDNLMSRALTRFERAMSERGRPLKRCKLTLHKNLPVGSGLGSSGCSVVSSFMALNELYERPLSERELLLMMGELEGEVSGSVHYDNVAPSFLGGLQLMVAEEREAHLSHLSQLSHSALGGTEVPLSVSLPTFPSWRWVLCYPGVQLSTAAAREVLPTRFSLGEALSYGRGLASFVHASHAGLEALAASRLRDVIAEPHRAPLVPHLAELKGALNNPQHELNALAVGISGAGPTIFALTRGDEDAERVAAWMRAHLMRTEQGFVVSCVADERGARRL